MSLLNILQRYKSYKKPASRYSQRNLRLRGIRCTFTEMIVSNACYLLPASLSLRISTTLNAPRNPARHFQIEFLTVGRIDSYLGLAICRFQARSQNCGRQL